jgi:cation transport ATPase
MSHHHAGDQAAAHGTEASLIRLAASLEQGSEHPLAAAIVEGAKARGVDLVPAADFASMTGKGVTGTIDGHRVGLGDLKLMDDLHVEAAPLKARAEAMRADGQTVMYVVVDSTMDGIIGVAMRTGADVAMKSAGVTLVKGDFEGDRPGTATQPRDPSEHQTGTLLRLHL